MPDNDQASEGAVDGESLVRVFVAMLGSGGLSSEVALKMAEQILGLPVLSAKKIMVCVEAVKLTGGKALVHSQAYPVLEYLLESAKDGLPLVGVQTQYSRGDIVELLGIARSCELGAWYEGWTSDEDAGASDFEAVVAQAERRLGSAPELAWLSFELGRVLFDAGCGDRLDRDHARRCIAKAERWWDHTVKNSKGQSPDLAVKAMHNITVARELQGKPCIIASTAAPRHAEVIEALRQVRDHRINADPVARDFFHVFWSRYYEWSPGVARVAAADLGSADAIRWAFVEPWLAWLEVIAVLGREPNAASEDLREEALKRLSGRIQSWCAELPERFEAKRHDDGGVWAAFEAFREEARAAFDNTRPNK